LYAVAPQEEKGKSFATRHVENSRLRVPRC
jgi:hypothetical protein